MSRISTAFRATAVAGSAFILAATTVNAAVIEQSQSQGQNMEVSVSTSGNSGSVNARAAGSQSQSQSQRIETATPVEYVYAPGRVVHTKVKYVRPVVVKSQWVEPVVMADGQVRLSWGYRGGTCQIRYTEVTRARTWAYATAASCDDGGVTISGLEAGKKYRFQVKPEHGMWSRVVVVKAQ